MGNDIKNEQERIAALETELKELKSKVPLSYIEPIPGFKIKRWFIIALVDGVLFWYVLLNYELTENQGALLFLVCAFGPIIWMTIMSKITGVKYFEDG